MRTWCHIFLAIYLLVALPTHAQESVDPKLAALDKLISNIEESSQLLGAAIKNSRVNAVLDPSIEGLTHQWYAQINMSTRQLQELGIDLQPQLEYMRDVVASGRNIPSLVTNLPASADSPENWRFEYYVAGREDNKGQFDQQTNNTCKAIYGKTCRGVLEKLAIAVNRYKNDYKEYSTGNVLKTLELYSDQWGNYFTKARSQTFLELAVNSYLYRDAVIQETFVPPPTWQVTLLHPSIMVEYVDKAKDGQQLSEALALEWIGANWWDDRNPIGYPLGISVASVYADRSDVDDFGIGVMLHVNNNYSLGVTWRDGDTGFFLTIDLLKLFEDKQSNFERYKAKLEKGFN